MRTILRPELYKTLVATLLFYTSACLASFSNDEQRMIDWIDEHGDEAVCLLEETVNISSGTMNHDGVRAVSSVLRRERSSLGFSTEWVDMREVNRAGHLFARKAGSGKKLLLIGHLDTVFEGGNVFQLFERDGDIAKGPGVLDMKSGNVVIVFALRALAEIGELEDIPIVVSYTGDEENVGLPIAVSRKQLIEAGRWADIALDFEQARHHDGKDWATISRRSLSRWQLEVSGTRAHSSKIFTDNVGAGAIFEASRILNQFFDEVRGQKYLTFNAGSIQSGTDVSYDPQQSRGRAFGKFNVVPQKVIVHGGIRTVSHQQLSRVRAEMRSIVAQNLPLTEASISFEDSYPSMPPTDGNRMLQQQLSTINEELGRGAMPVLDPSIRGASDISFIAPDVDGLAGLGGLGEGGHTPNESLELSSMTLAVQRAAILIYRLSRQHP